MSEKHEDRIRTLFDIFAGHPLVFTASFSNRDYGGGLPHAVSAEPVTFLELSRVFCIMTNVYSTE